LTITPDQKQQAIKLRDYFRNKGYKAYLQVMGSGDKSKLILVLTNLYPEDWVIIKKDPYLRSKLYDGVIEALYGRPAEDFTRIWYLGRYGEELPGQPHYP